MEPLSFSNEDAQDFGTQKFLIKMSVKALTLE